MKPFIVTLISDTGNSSLQIQFDGHSKRKANKVARKKFQVDGFHIVKVAPKPFNSISNENTK